MKSSEINEFISLGKSVLHAYTESEWQRKERFHSLGKRVCRALAKELGLPSGSYDVWSNKGGMAVAGEITLHCENVYVQFSDSCYRSGFMVRACKGRKDYCGGVNNWIDFSDLRDIHGTAKKIKKLI